MLAQYKAQMWPVNASDASSIFTLWSCCDTLAHVQQDSDGKIKATWPNPFCAWPCSEQSHKVTIGSRINSEDIQEKFRSPAEQDRHAKAAPDWRMTLPCVINSSNQVQNLILFDRPSAANVFPKFSAFRVRLFAA